MAFRFHESNEINTFCWVGLAFGAVLIVGIIGTYVMWPTWKLLVKIWEILTFKKPPPPPVKPPPSPPRVHHWYMNDVLAIDALDEHELGPRSLAAADGATESPAAGTILVNGQPNRDVFRQKTNASGRVIAKDVGPTRSVREEEEEPEFRRLW